MKKVFVILIAMLMCSAATTMALEYGITKPISDSSGLIRFVCQGDNAADTSVWYNCASYSAMSVQLKAIGVTETDSNGVSAIIQWCNSSNSPGDYDGSFRSLLVKDSISAVFGDTNWVIANMSLPPANWYRTIVRPTAANKVDETGGGTYAWMRIFWVRDLFTR